MQNNPYEAPVAEGGGVPGSLSTARHEFSEQENRQIAETGKRSWMWGFIALVSGILGTVGLVIAFVLRDDLAIAGVSANAVTSFILVLLSLTSVNLVIAVFYLSAGSSLKAIVKTQGADIEHMMRSLRKLGTAFFIEFAVGTVTFVGGFATAILLVVYQPEVEEVDAGAVEEVEDFDD